MLDAREGIVTRRRTQPESRRDCYEDDDRSYRVRGRPTAQRTLRLRLIDGTDAMPLVRARATEPVVRWALETYGVASARVGAACAL